MQTDHARVPEGRSGFTLVEMLVVLSIILTLAVITVLFMPRFGERQKVPRGASLLQGWLMMAKQRAIRDRTATGVRLQLSAGNLVRDLQYIRKPDDYSPSGLLIGWAPATRTCTFGPGVNLLGSALSDASSRGDESSLVQAGDYLQLQSGGLVHQILEVRASDCKLASDLLPPNVPFPSGPSGGVRFRIIRQPRLLPGEQPLQLPQDVTIDPSQCLNLPTRLSISAGTSQYGYWEVLFSPSGAVVGQGTGNTPIALRLRDVTQDANTGDQALIAIYPRTGLIANQPVAVGPDPFLFLRDGRSSGF